MKKLLRWWYRITGQADDAKMVLGIALLQMANGHGDEIMQIWKQEYRHIYELTKP